MSYLPLSVSVLKDQAMPKPKSKSDKGCDKSKQQFRPLCCLLGSEARSVSSRGSWLFTLRAPQTGSSSSTPRLHFLALIPLSTGFRRLVNRWRRFSGSFLSFHLSLDGSNPNCVPALHTERCKKEALRLERPHVNGVRKRSNDRRLWSRRSSWGPSRWLRSLWQRSPDCLFQGFLG